MGKKRNKEVILTCPSDVRFIATGPGQEQQSIEFPRDAEAAAKAYKECLYRGKNLEKGFRLGTLKYNLLQMIRRREDFLSNWRSVYSPDEDLMDWYTVQEEIETLREAIVVIEDEWGHIDEYDQP